MKQATEQEPSPPRKFDFSSKKFKTFALLLLVMLVEAAGIYVWLPDPATNNSSADDSGEFVDETDSTVESVEVKINDFQVTNTSPENSDLNLEFTLAAVVSRDAEQSFKEAVNDLQKYRVRQAVERVCRSATREELEDPVHSTLKRLMKEEINKILGKSYIIDIIISGYQIREL